MVYLADLKDQTVSPKAAPYISDEGAGDHRAIIAVY